MSSFDYSLICRSSDLSKTQAESVIDLIKAKYPHLNTTLKTIKSEGDQNLSTALRYIGGKMLFTRKIDLAVMENDHYIGVHSLKDIDSKIPKNLYLGGFQQRIDPADVLVSMKKINSISDLKPNSKIGTVSLRRKSQLLTLRKDLIIIPLRGNILRRINLLKDKECDALILAKAGLLRLKEKGLITKDIYILELPIAKHIPAPGQGIVALTCSKLDSDTCRMLDKLSDVKTKINALYERAFVIKAEMDCFSPFSAYSWNVGSKIMLMAKLYNDDGSIACETQLTLSSNYTKSIKFIEEKALVFKHVYKRFDKSRLTASNNL